MEKISKRLLYHYGLPLIIVTQTTSTTLSSSSSNPKITLLPSFSIQPHYTRSFSHLLSLSLSLSLSLVRRISAWASSFYGDNKHFKLAAIHGFRRLLSDYLRSFSIEVPELR